jgi:GTP-binding protein LepA
MHEVLEGIVSTVPPPGGDANAPLKALLFDSWFDSYQGAVILVRVFEGTLHQGMTVRLMSSDNLYDVQRLGVLPPVR